MAKEDFGITVKKHKDFSEWFTQINQKAELTDLRYNVQGFIVHMPWAVRITRRIYDLFNEEVERDGHEPLLFPTVIPEENLIKEAEHAGFVPDVFWVEKAGEEKLEKRLALRPTGETAFYSMYSLWIRSYKDLPFKRYQTEITTFRNEKTTRPFIRGREFMFFETHDVFATHEESFIQIKKDMEIMDKIVKEKLCIPFIFFQRPSWDKFKGAKDTFASDTLLPDGKTIQISSTHDLAQKFAIPFGISFTDKDEQKKYGWQTCFGPGIWRIMASLISMHGDDTGLILPFDIAPTQIIIVPITFSKNKADSKKVLSKCKEIEKELKDYRIKLDLSDNSPGFKFNRWELLGVPLRIEVGPKEAKSNKATLVLRDTKEKITMSISKLNKEIEKQSKSLNKRLSQRAETWFKSQIRATDNLEDLKLILEKEKGFIKVPFCSIEKEGEKCADILKEKTNGGSVRGISFAKHEKAEGNCIICKNKANYLVYIAKSY